MVAAALAAHPEVLAEAYQVALRAAGDAGAYEALKAVTRGTAVTLADMHAALPATGVDAALLARLQALTPAAFIGHAPAFAKRALARAEGWLTGRSVS